MIIKSPPSVVSFFVGIAVGILAQTLIVHYMYESERQRAIEAGVGCHDQLTGEFHYNPACPEDDE